MASDPNSKPKSKRAASPDDEIFAPVEGELGDTTGGRYTNPSEEPGTWDLQGLVKLETLVDAINMQLIRGSVRNAGSIYRRRVAAFRDSLARSAGAWAIGRKLGTEAAKEAVKWINLVFTIWKNATLQKEVEAALRRAAIQTQREVKFGGMNRDHNRNSRLMERVYTRKV